MAVEEFGIYKGYRLDETRFNQALARKYILYADRHEMINDTAAELHRTVTALLKTTDLQHRFVYKILPNYHVLVGIDQRDLPAEEEKEEPDEQNGFDPAE